MKKGFTLVELLAVIVILAVILVIAIPQITNVIKQTRKNSLGSTAKLIAAKAEEKEVENDALGNNETIKCEDLVKLDSNYGTCTVSKNASGKWEVTIAGAGKFAGYSCTGTKNNMNCSESSTSEYVYSFGTPQYEYTYTVKEGKSEECKTYLENNVKDILVNEEGLTSEEAQTEIEAVCSNSNDVRENVSNYTASQWFADEIQYGDFTYEDISSFVTKSDAPVLQNAPVEDYRTLKYPGTNDQAQVFIRWNGNETEFSNESEKSVCILYKGNTNNDVNCFKYTTYKETLQSIANVFGKSNCSGEGVEELTLLDKLFGVESVLAKDASPVELANCTDESWNCTLYTDGHVGYHAPDAYCSIYNGSVLCVSEGDL